MTIGVRVTRIEPGGPPEKASGQWRTPVRYTLEDGRQTTANLYTSTKKAGVARSAAREIDNLEVLFDAEGNFWGTRATYSLSHVKEKLGI